jgi:hypothetical protein
VQLRLAMLSAGAALIGALIGGAASYLITIHQIHAGDTRILREHRRETYSEFYSAIIKWRLAEIDTWRSYAARTDLDIHLDPNTALGRDGDPDPTTRAERDVAYRTLKKKANAVGDAYSTIKFQATSKVTTAATNLNDLVTTISRELNHLFRLDHLRSLNAVAKQTWRTRVTENQVAGRNYYTLRTRFETAARKDLDINTQ